MTPEGKSLGRCPLKHTAVKAQVSGYVSRVSVRQTFHNTFKSKIEATYTFPLPQDAAVDEMTMRIGSRVIKGIIRKREDAREIYEQAREVASLLDQERPNIFTQSVANIEPGATVEIEEKLQFHGYTNSVHSPIFCWLSSSSLRADNSWSSSTISPYPERNQLIERGRSECSRPNTQGHSFRTLQ